MSRKLLTETEMTARVMEKYSCPMSAVDHFIRRERNLSTGKTLCIPCDGTGSRFVENPVIMGLHKICEVCNGQGIK